MAFPNVPTPENPASGMALAAKGPEVLVVLLFASVAAPLAEEFMIRGLLFRGLAQRYGVTVGALASSMVFAGLHPQLPAGFLPIFVIGVALCYIYRSSGSLVPAVIVHGISNMVVLLFVRAGMG
jgi:membrane protease YdiL (CAAX protease family)